jgi:hypothetical protein
MRSKCPMLFSLLIVSSSVYAEHGCQDGFIPVNRGNGQTCVADYNLPYWANKNDESSTVPSNPQFAEKWGAIAIDDTSADTGLGTVSDMPSKRKAEKVALAKCRENGGAACKIKLSYYNQCAAIAWGDTGYNAARAATIEEASEISIRECSVNHAGCKIYYSECSLPVRVQ